MAQPIKQWIAEHDVNIYIPDMGGKGNSGIHDYDVTFDRVNFPGPGRVILDLAKRTRRNQPIPEGLQYVEVSFNGIDKANLTDFILFDAPTSLKWTQAAAAQGPLVLRFRLCEEPLQLLCVVSFIALPPGQALPAAQNLGLPQGGNYLIPQNPNVPAPVVNAAPQPAAVNGQDKKCCTIS